MTGKLDSRVAIVTGGGTGIGEAICLKFALEGAMVLVNGLPEDPIDDVVAAVRKDGGKVVAFAADISDDRQARACVDEALRNFGRLDVLVNMPACCWQMRKRTICRSTNSRSRSATIFGPPS